MFPDDLEELPILACEAIRVRLDKIELRHPREWGACWLGLYVWNLLELDIFGEDVCRQAVRGQAG